jgi:hypothetical protein
MSMERKMSDRANELLADYHDAVVRGEQPEVESYLARCGPEEREPLRAAIRDLEAIAPAPVPVQRAQRVLESMRRARRNRERYETAQQRLRSVAEGLTDPVGFLQGALGISGQRLKPATEAAFYRQTPGHERPDMLSCASPGDVLYGDARPTDRRDPIGLVREERAGAAKRARRSDAEIAALERELDRKAEETLREHGVSTPPVDLESLAGEMLLAVAEAPIEAPEGCLVTDGEIGAILIGSSMPEPLRRRFTLAHEIAHFILHRDQGAFCDTSAELQDYTTELEQEANLLASRLLMPASLLRDRLPDLQSRPPAFALADGLCREFEVSLEAALRRMVRLSSTRCALVISREGVVTAFERSPDLGCRVRWNQSVPAESAAARLQSAGPGDTGGSRLPARRWLSAAAESSHASTDPLAATAQEESRRMEIGIVYSLIVLQP